MFRPELIQFVFLLLFVLEQLGEIFGRMFITRDDNDVTVDGRSSWRWMVWMISGFQLDHVVNRLEFVVDSSTGVMASTLRWMFLFLPATSSPMFTGRRWIDTLRGPWLFLTLLQRFWTANSRSSVSILDYKPFYQKTLEAFPFPVYRKYTDAFLWEWIF